MFGGVPGMLTTKLDLSDAYFHIPISLVSRKFLRFVWKNKVYQPGRIQALIDLLVSILKWGTER
jgi:hypothetical protein